MSNNYKVTIGIPTLNREKYLREALYSILKQTYKNIEIVISNNSSTDGTKEMLETIKDGRLKVINQSSRISIFNNWNECLNNATGDFFILVSDDDILESNAIEEMVKPYLKNDFIEPNEIAFVTTNVNIIDGCGNIVGIGKEAPQIMDGYHTILNFFKGSIDMYPCKILFRTSDIKQLSGYSVSEFKLSSDADLWMKSFNIRKFAFNIKAQLVRYRIHEKNLTNQSSVIEWISDMNQLSTVSVEPILARNHYMQKMKIKKQIDIYIARIINGKIYEMNKSNKSIRSRLKLIYTSKIYYFKNITTTYHFFKGLILCTIPLSLIFKIRRTGV